MTVVAQINPIGVVLILFGLLGVIWPYRVARFQESINAIGSTDSVFEIEPAGWMVTLTRILGVVIILYGLAVLFGYLPFL